MNINKYIKTFGNKTFDEMPFNDVDGLIFAEMAYINFNLAIGSDEMIALQALEIKDKKAFYYGSVDARYNQTMINLMQTSERYKNVKLGYCELIVDDVQYKQFFAFTIFLPNDEMFVSFRGTDITLLGWREDLFLAYQDTFPSQLMAVSYLNNILEKTNNRFYVGGHSKGGNLALYSVLFMEEKHRDRLIKAYSYDGPGFRFDINKISSYETLKERLVKYLTFNDVIGVIYNKIKDANIVYSNGILLGGHDPFTWKINKNGQFSLSKERSKNSKKSEEAMMNWLTEMNDAQKQLAVTVLYDYLGESKTIYDLLLSGARIISRGKKALKKYTKEQIDEAKTIFRALGKYYLNAYSPRKKKIKEENMIEDKGTNE